MAAEFHVRNHKLKKNTSEEVLLFWKKCNSDSWFITFTSDNSQNLIFSFSMYDHILLLQ